MKGKSRWIALPCLLVATLMLASCSTSTTTQATTKTQTTTQTTPVTSAIPVATARTTTTSTAPTATTPTTSAANWWNSLGTPQYGGTLNFRMNANPSGFDAYYARAAPWDIFQSAMGGINWTVSPDQWDYKGKWAPDDIKVGDVVDTYEIPDLSTIIYHLHQGIHFALDTGSAASILVGGRELTADDVVFTFNRFNGLAGYKPSVSKNAQMNPLTSVTAQDKYTVTFKFSAPSAAYFDAIMDPVTSNAIIPHEVVEKYGDMNNWRNVVGSGAYMLQDFVSGSSGTFVRNSNYFGYDERYPKNHLPYIDKINLVIIPDMQTALSAVRTGKVDVMETLTLDQRNTVQKNSPQLVWQTRPAAGYTIQERNDKAPFTDIRVRQAMTQAIDIPTIAATYFGGSVPGITVGIVSTSMTGWYIPYAQWPQSLKDQYSYSPTAAKALLAAAGFPNGFKTNVLVPTNEDVGLMEIYKSYFAAVGIDMTIKLMDYPTYYATTTAHNFDQMSIQQPIGVLAAPSRMMETFHSTSFTNYCIVNDPAYDALVDKFYATPDVPGQKILVQQADMYAFTHFFEVQALPTVENIAYQPWFKGWHGEVFGYWSKRSFARYWIDQPLKKSMGY